MFSVSQVNFHVVRLIAQKMVALFRNSLIDEVPEVVCDLRLIDPTKVNAFKLHCERLEYGLLLFLGRFPIVSIPLALSPRCAEMPC